MQIANKFVLTGIQNSPLEVRAISQLRYKLQNVLSLTSSGQFYLLLLPIQKQYQLDEIVLFGMGGSRSRASAR